MNWQDAALATAGIIGSGTAVLHGILVQRFLVKPIETADIRLSAPIRRLVSPLLHFSTVVWFLGGLALIAAAIWFEHDARLTTALFVGGLFLYGAIGNLWATRGRHPGWMLMAAAVALIAVGVGTSGG